MEVTLFSVQFFFAILGTKENVMPFNRSLIKKNFKKAIFQKLSLGTLLYLVLVMCCFSTIIISCDNFSGPTPAKLQPTPTNTVLPTTGTVTTMMPGNSCDTSNVKYSTSVKSVLEANCVGCHSGAAATAGVDVSTYQGLKRVVDAGRFPNVLTGTNGSPQMPPGQRLNACDIAKIQAWVRKGAAND